MIPVSAFLFASPGTSSRRWRRGGRGSGALPAGPKGGCGLERDEVGHVAVDALRQDEDREAGQQECRAPGGVDFPADGECQQGHAPADPERDQDAPETDLFDGVRFADRAEIGLFFRTGRHDPEGRGTEQDARGREDEQ